MFGKHFPGGKILVRCISPNILAYNLVPAFCRCLGKAVGKRLFEQAINLERHGGGKDAHCFCPHGNGRQEIGKAKVGRLLLAKERKDELVLLTTIII